MPVTTGWVQRFSIKLEPLCLTRTTLNLPALCGEMYNDYWSKIGAVRFFEAELSVWVKTRHPKLVDHHPTRTLYMAFGAALLWCSSALVGSSST